MATFSRGRRNKLAKKEQPKKKPKPPITEIHSTLGRLIAIVLGLATLIGVPAALIAFWPRLTVTASGLHNESNAYSETFMLTNVGFLPFENVRVAVELCSFKTAEDSMRVSGCATNDPSEIIGFTADGWNATEIRRDESLSVVLSDVLDSNGGRPSPSGIPSFLTGLTIA